MRCDGEDILVLEPRLAGDDIGFGFFMWRYEVSPALRPVGLSFLPSRVPPTSPFVHCVKIVYSALAADNRSTPPFD